MEHLSHWAIGQVGRKNLTAQYSFIMKNTLVRFLRAVVDIDLGKMFHRPDLPITFRLLNWTVLLTTLTWPILLFVSVFLFDSPSNQRKATIFFFLVLFYPFILMASTSAAFKIFNKNKPLGIALSFWSCLYFAIVMLMLVSF